MFRIDHDSAVGAKPTKDPAGAAGYFTEGDAQAGQAATRVTKDWLNILQEEIVSVLTAAGIAPDKADDTQLTAAINALIAAGAAAAVPAATTTLQGKVELATQAEVDTGADTTRAVVPARLKARLDALLAGYLPLTGGILNGVLELDGYALHVKSNGTVSLFRMQNDAGTNKLVMRWWEATNVVDFFHVSSGDLLEMKGDGSLYFNSETVWRNAEMQTGTAGTDPVFRYFIFPDGFKIYMCVDEYNGENPRNLVWPFAFTVDDPPFVNITAADPGQNVSAVLGAFVNAAGANYRVRDVADAMVPGPINVHLMAMGY